MNLATMLDSIKQQVNHDPQLSVFDDYLTQVINNHYFSILDARLYTFNQKNFDMTLLPSITTGTVSVVNGSHQVTITGVILDGREMGANLIVAGLNYEIGRVVTPTTIYLTKKYEGVTNPTATYEIRFSNYNLPEDLVEVLSVMVDDQSTGQLIGLSRDMQDEMYLRDDINVGTPRAYIEVLPTKERCPVKPPTTKVLAGGALEVGMYDYCYTFTYAGRESTPSTLASATTTPGAQTIQVYLPEYTTDNGTVAGNPTGRWRRVYRRFQPENIWYALADVTEAAVSINDASAEPPSREENAVLYTSPQARRLRVYPRSSDKLTAQIRYKYRPRPLMKDTDEPELPGDCHTILVYRAIADVYIRYSGDASAKMWLQRANEIQAMMDRRYISSKSINYRRGQWDAYEVTDVIWPLWGPATQTP